MKMKTLLGTLIIGMLTAAMANAEISVIVHPSNGDSLSNKEVERIFLGKAKSFPGGEQAIPVNQAEGSATRDAFDTTILDKSSSQLKAYWSKLVFTGKGSPPQEADNDDAVKAIVSANPNTIGYIDSGAVDGTVKVVLSF